MAPKLAILLAMFSLLAMRHVSAFRTTVTTTVVEEDNPEQQEQQRCQEQIQRQKSLQSCQRYLSQQQRSFYDLAMVVDAKNPREQEILSQCCAELRNIDDQCRCQAVSHAYRQQRQQGESQRQVQERQTRQLAESLPSKCDLSPQRCQVESVWA